MAHAIKRTGALLLLLILSGLAYSQSAEPRHLPPPPPDNLVPLPPIREQAPDTSNKPSPSTTNKDLVPLPPIREQAPDKPNKPSPPTPNKESPPEKPTQAVAPTSPALPPLAAIPPVPGPVEELPRQAMVASASAKKFLAATGHPGREGSWLFDADYLLLRPRRGSQDYAVLSRENALLTPLGDVRTVDGAYSSGLRLGTGYRCASEPWDVLAEYSYYHNRGQEEAAATGTDVLYPTLTMPTFVNQAAAARAESSVHFNLYDLALGRQFDLTQQLGVRVYSGFRAGNLAQKFAVAYTGSPLVSRDEVRRAVVFDGLGLRMGGEADFRFLDNLGFYFRSSASLLSGRFRSELNENADRETVVAIADRFDRIVPLLDMGVGMNYQVGGLRLSLGYELLNWFNVPQGIDFVDDLNPAKLSRRMGDVGFDGLRFRLRYEY
jgi:hypothetical protein